MLEYFSKVDAFSKCIIFRQQIMRSSFLHSHQKLVWIVFLLQLRSVMSDSLRPHGLQHARLPCPSPSPRVVQTHVHWLSDAIQPSYPLPTSSPFVFSLSQHQGLFQWVSSSYQIDKILELQHQLFQWTLGVDFLSDWLGWVPCSPRDSWESSPAPTFNSINSLLPSLLYGPTVTSINDCSKNHSFDCMDLCWQSDVFAFQCTL